MSCSAAQMILLSCILWFGFVVQWTLVETVQLTTCEQQCVRNIITIWVLRCVPVEWIYTTWEIALVQLHTKLPIVFVQFWVQGLALLALHSSTSADRMESHLQPLNQHNVFVHIRTCAISHVRVQCKSTHTGTHLNTHIGWSDVTNTLLFADVVNWTVSTRVHCTTKPNHKIHDNRIIWAALHDMPLLFVFAWATCFRLMQELQVHVFHYSACSFSYFSDVLTYTWSHVWL